MFFTYLASVLHVRTWVDRDAQFLGSAWLVTVQLIYGDMVMRTSRNVTMYDILAMAIALSLLAAAVAPMVRRLNLLG
jgi:hypothetical protein